MIESEMFYSLCVLVCCKLKLKHNFSPGNLSIFFSIFAKEMINAEIDSKILEYARNSAKEICEAADRDRRKLGFRNIIRMNCRDLIYLLQPLSSWGEFFCVALKKKFQAVRVTSWLQYFFTRFFSPKYKNLLFVFMKLFIEYSIDAERK